jgi:GDP/UDP-N,N'-diacetylbacillosamine 2-epimerase (hydrolysing)
MEFAPQITLNYLEKNLNLILKKMTKLRNKKKICIVSTSRADLGQLSGIVQKFQKSKKFITEFVISGLHLSNLTKFSFHEVEDFNLSISKKIYIKMKNFQKKDINLYFSEYVKKFSDYFSKSKPDFLLILGDRYETLAIAISAFYFDITIGHLHGGEVTLGSKDDSTRHAISKLSNYHFVVNNIFKNRLLRMGENPKSIFTVGSPGLTNLNRVKFLSKTKIEKKLKIKLKKKNIIVTFHPEIDKIKTEILIDQLFKTLKSLKDANIFITSPNGDIYSDIINKKIKNFIRYKKNAHFFESLGFINYLSLSKHCNFVIGNSSSAITEMPFLGVPSINIGLRQMGRPFAKSVFSTEYSRKKIKIAIQYFLKKKRRYKNQKLFYLNNNTNSKVFNFINSLNFKEKKYKKFFD